MATGDSSGRSWPTPTATDQGPGHGESMEGSESLPTVAQQWPTPTTQANRKSRRALTRSTENGRRSGGGNSSTPALEQVAELVMGEIPSEMVGTDLGPQAKVMLDLARNPERWPTPNAFDAVVTGIEVSEESREAQLRRPHSKPTGRGTGSRRNTTGSLAKDIEMGLIETTSPSGPQDLPTPQAGPDCQPASSPRSVPRPVLSPRFVSMLMGFPMGWDDPEATVTKSQMETWERKMLDQVVMAIHHRRKNGTRSKRSGTGARG